MHRSIYFRTIIYYMLFTKEPIFLSAATTTHIENEEVHYEIWKERRVKYFEDNENLSSDENGGDQDSFNKIPQELNANSVPQVMIDLFNRNKDARLRNTSSELIVRSFQCKHMEYANSSNLALEFDLSSIQPFEIFQNAQLTYPILPNPQTKRQRNLIIVNGVFEKVKFINGITIDTTRALRTWMKENNKLIPDFELTLESTHGLIKPAEKPILIIQTLVNSEREKLNEMSELIQHEKEVLLTKGRRNKRKILSNEIPVVAVAPSQIADDYDELEEFNSDINRSLIISNKLGIHGKQHNAHMRRHLVKKMWGPCRRRPFYVNFSEVKFDSWIIAPKGYQAYECYGRCGFPLGAHLTPTKHAIMRAMLNGISPKKATRACCVPTKLEPISLLYLDDNGVVTYKYNYDDMIVADCGCR